MDSRVGTTFGKYTISRLLGKGGMGEVYEAYDTDKGRTVALKILADGYSTDANFRTRFQRESRAAAVLQEPHVIPIHDWGEIDGHLYIDMRLVQGQTLDELLAEGTADTLSARSASSVRSPRRLMPRTPKASSIEISSRRTSSSRLPTSHTWSTSVSPRPPVTPNSPPPGPRSAH